MKHLNDRMKQVTDQQKKQEHTFLVMKKETALNLAGTGLSKSVSNLTKSLRQRQALAKKLSKVPYGGIKKNESLLTRLNIEQNMREQEEIELDYYINYITR